MPAATVVAAAIACLPMGAAAAHAASAGGAPPDQIGVAAVQAGAAPGEAGSSGATQIDQEAAVRIAAERFAPPPGLGPPEVSMTSFDGRPTYHVWWRGPRGGASQSVWVDPRGGEVFLMSRDLGPTSLQTRGRSMPADSLRAAAETLVRRLLPDRWETLRPFDHADPPRLARPGAPEFGFAGGPLTSQYQVDFVQSVGGVPFPERRVRVRVDRQTGEVVFYRLDWPVGVDLPDGTAKVSPDAAAAALRSAHALEPANLPVRDPAGGAASQFIPVWRPRLQPLDLDASTGALRDARGFEVDPAALAAAVSIPPTPEGAAGGQVDRAGPPARLSRDEARDLARRLLAIPADLAPRFEGDRGWPPGAASYQFYWEVEQPPKGALTYQVSVDPELGVLSSVSRGAPKAAALDPSIGLGGNEQVPNIGEAAAREKALALVARWYPRLAAQLRLRGAAEVARSGFGPVRLDGYSFAFERVVEGVPVIGDGVQVSIEAKTGEWLSAEVRWTRGEAPPAQGAVGRDVAERAFFGERQAVLLFARATAPPEPYAPSEQGGGAPFAAPWAGHGPARLVYRLLPTPGVPGHGVGAVVDARTAKLLDALGREVDQLVAGYRQLAGHWAGRELEAMVERGALAADAGDVAPQRALSRIEALRLLVGGYFFNQGGSRASSPWNDLPRAHPLFPYAAAALELGLLEPPSGPGAMLRPQEPVGRAEFAQLSARALGLGPLVRSSLEVADPFPDVAGASAEVRRAVALLAALGVVRGSEGGFRPDDPVSRAEAAAWVVRMLVAKPPQ